MTTLAELQSMFCDAVLESGAEQSATLALSRHVNATDGLSSIQHLQIYQRAVMGTLERALEQIYPVCRRLVGDDFFGGMDRAFIREFPSQSPDLADYGEEFGQFVAAFEPAESLPYLADVARLEWLWHRAFNAPDEPALDPTALSAVPPADIESLVFQLHASAGLLRSRYPASRIWQVNQADWGGDQAVDLNSGGVAIIVWRHGTDMHMDELDQETWELLNLVQCGAPMRELAYIAALDHILPKSVQKGWIGGFRSGSNL